MEKNADCHKMTLRIEPLFNQQIRQPLQEYLKEQVFDSAFGPKETPKGYHGVLVITEYLSKYPYTVPLVEKPAEYIAEKLFLYISMFGSPKELLFVQLENG